MKYSCPDCGKSFSSDEIVYRCPSCTAVPGGYQRGNLSVELELRARVTRGRPVNPHDLLPLPISSAFPVGGTPLVESRKHPGTFLKLDYLNPSGSLKDRASLLVAEQAMLHGEKRVALASTGNAGASMSCAGAAYGLSIVLFVPASAPRAKLLQSLIYGACVVPVKGTYDDAFALSIRYTEARGGINRNTGFNPLTVEGKKTVSIELYNQLGCKAPDVVYIPVGDGVIFSGACKGFVDLHQAGLIDRMPVMIAVQAAGSNSIARSWREGREVILDRTSTIADSLSVESPACGRMALAWLARTNGRAVEVTDAEISAAQAELGREAGAFVEPSSAAAWAGYLKDRMNVGKSASVVVLLTGTGFKDTGAAEKLVTLPEACAPDLDPALELLERVYRVSG